MGIRRAVTSLPLSPVLGLRVSPAGSAPSSRNLPKETETGRGACPHCACSEGHLHVASEPLLGRRGWRWDSRSGASESGAGDLSPPVAVFSSDLARSLQIPQRNSQALPSTRGCGGMFFFLCSVWGLPEDGRNVAFRLFCFCEKRRKATKYRPSIRTLGL